MSYIDALYKKDEDKIYVVERDPKKGRVFVEYDARYVFYYQTSNFMNMISIQCSDVWKRIISVRKLQN